MTDYVDMHGWTIRAERFTAPIRTDFHYFGSWQGRTYVGPRNTAEDVWTEIGEIRAEIRPQFLPEVVSAGYRRPGPIHDEIERATVIALARRLDSASLDAEACAAGPGRYEGADDLALVVALDIIGMHGAADDSAGSVDETGRHLSRFGRFVLEHDSHGFVSVETFATDDRAQAELDSENAKYADQEEM